MIFATKREVHLVIDALCSFLSSQSCQTDSFHYRLTMQHYDVLLRTKCTLEQNFQPARNFPFVTSLYAWGMLPCSTAGPNAHNLIGLRATTARVKQQVKQLAGHPRKIGNTLLKF